MAHGTSVGTLALLLSLTDCLQAFSVFSIPRSHDVLSIKLRATSDALGFDFLDENFDLDDITHDRRSFLESGVVILAAATSATLPSQSAKAASASDPVCVIGYNGRTGTEVVSYLLSKGMVVRATSRGGEYNAKDTISGTSSVSLFRFGRCRKCLY